MCAVQTDAPGPDTAAKEGGGGKQTEEEQQAGVKAASTMALSSSGHQVLGTQRTVGQERRRGRDDLAAFMWKHPPLGLPCGGASTSEQRRNSHGWGLGQHRLARSDKK